MSEVKVATYNEAKKELEEILTEKGYKKPVLVRLGGTREYPDFKIEINSSEATLNAINKEKSKTILLKKGLPTLPMFDTPNQFPCVIKGKIRSKGTSVFFCEDLNDYRAYSKLLRNDGWYVEPFFNYTSEYRLHCTPDKVFFAVKKIKNNDQDRFVNAKNHHNVRDFMKPRLWKQIQEACCKAIKAHGLDIACVDVGYCSTTDPHSFVIHELNTNPELLANTFNAYVEELDKLIKERI